MPGYIKLYRDLQNNPLWFEKPYTRGQAWVDMLFRCNHICVKMPPQYQSIWVLRGQFLLSNLKLAEAWGWEEKKVRRFMEFLVSDGMIRYFPHNKFCVYECVKYAELQASEIDYLQLINAEQKPNKRRTKAEQTPTNKNDNKYKNDKKYKEIYTPAFENFYKSYPRSQAKADTYKNWNALLNTYTEDQLAQFAENYRSYHESIPETDRPFPFSSNNFFGKKAYYLDYLEPKKWYGKSRVVPKQTTTGPPNKGNFEQRQYDEQYFEGLYKEV